MPGIAGHPLCYFNKSKQAKNVCASSELMVSLFKPALVKTGSGGEMIPPEWLDQAARRLEGQIERTPLTYDPELEVYLKWENRQLTGSFKIRGALNKILSLDRWEQQRGLVTASAGNHGQGVAVAGRLVGAPVTVFASTHAVPAKLDAMRSLGAELRLVPGGYEDAERAAQDYAGENELTWVSPYNDGQVIAGQATVVREMLEQMASQAPAVVIVPVGGGGLISGAGMALEGEIPRPRLVGVQSEASPFFYHIFHYGSQAEAIELESLADGLAGAVEHGSITIPLVRSFVDDIVLVTEEQVAQAIAYAWEKHGQKIEGSAAVSLAAVLHGHVKEKPAAAIISGGNIQPEIHAQIIIRHKEGTA
jgi:threonine dehydratase